MSENKTLVQEGLDRSEMIDPEAVDRAHLGFKGPEEPGEEQVLEIHKREQPHEPRHIDLYQDEYTPEEVARILGTSLEVVMHAVWTRELGAERKGRSVVCIPRHDLIAWLVKRGSSV